MKKSIALSILSLCASLIFATSFGMDGKAVIAEVDEMPEGYFAKSVGYLPGDCISVTNPNTGNTCEVLILGAIDPAEGVAILLTPEAASSLSVAKDQDLSVQLTKRSGELDESFTGKAIIASVSNNSTSDDFEIPAKVEVAQNPVAVESSNSQNQLPNAVTEITNDDSFESDLAKIEMKSPAEDGYVAEVEQPAEETETIAEVTEPAEETQEVVAVAEEVEPELVEEELIDENTEDAIASEEVTEDVPETQEGVVEVLSTETEEAVAVEEPVEETTEIAEAEEPVEESTEIAEAETPVEESTEAVAEAEETVETPVEENTEIAEAETPVEETTESVAEVETPVEESTEAVAEAEPVEESTETVAIAEDEMIFATDDEVIPDPVADTEIAKAEETEDYEPILLPTLQDTETVPVTEVVVDDEQTEEVAKAEEQEEVLPIVEPTEDANIAAVEEPVQQPTESTEESILIPSEPIVLAPVPVAEEPAASFSSAKDTGVMQKHIVDNLNALSKDKYYIQIAIMGDVRNMENLFAKYSKYPLIAVPRNSREYMILAGPCTEDEYGTLLTRFKAFGFKDAFVKRLN